MRGTGGGPPRPPELELKEYEEEISKMLGPDTISGMEGSFDTDATGADKTQDSNQQQTQTCVEEEDSPKTLQIDDDDLTFSQEPIETQLSDPHETLEAIQTDVAEPQEWEESIHSDTDPFPEAVKQLTATLSSNTAVNRKKQNQLKRAVLLIHKDFMSLNEHLKESADRSLRLKRQHVDLILHQNQLIMAQNNLLRQQQLQGERQQLHSTHTDVAAREGQAGTSNITPGGSATS
ncbi:uncharacterized protein LOC108715360 [Xenopus laevis]|uniref:Uncharacterized protein LOC108715360 n=2 Tax=Xenopus laevis TaxID=8355 RepID=A0A1L8GEE0_XENLA|nr:uncharacterized protein LOC108715360 [Xenopus laevis]OCT82223.1 hypothetical protein XELAEV_18024738mg [Xenopus laevis]